MHSLYSVLARGKGQKSASSYRGEVYFFSVSMTRLDRFLFGIFRFLLCLSSVFVVRCVVGFVLYCCAPMPSSISFFFFFFSLVLREENTRAGPPLFFTFRAATASPRPSFLALDTLLMNANPHCKTNITSHQEQPSV